MSAVPDIDFADGIKGRITFLEDGIFRYNVDPKGEFSDYATPRSKSHTAKIQAQPDTSDTYSKPSATVADKGDTIEITGGKATVILDKATGKMSIKSGDRVVVSESASLDLDKKGTVQTLAKEKSENFFGGGTQNGRFLHTNQTIAISNTNNWTDGGVASPNPFYWTSDGYGVLRNTFAEGSYDFGSTDSSTVTTLHSENEFDAYYFVATNEGASNVATEMLQDYYKVTGNPVLLPEYGFYLGHLNAYNRDGWSTTSGQKKWETKGSKSSSEKGDVKYESGMSTGYKLDGTLAAETLNGEGPSVDTENMKATDFDRQFSARQVIDDYEDNDMPLGWFLPNDGYGAGYGQNGYYKTGGVNSDGASSADRLNAVRANVDNLKKFTEYANSKGVNTGLWTQSNREPDTPTFGSQIRDHFADLNDNGVYDVYDYSFTMAGLDGGTKQKGKVAGSLAVIPSKTEVEAGDEITVDVYAADAKNVNALGALVNFKSDQFEFVSESIAQDGSTAGMENLSREKVQFADRTQTINLAFANRGDGKLYNGTGAVASFKLKAKTAGKVELPSTSWLIGPACDALEFASDGTVTMPDAPQPTVAEYGQDAFNITMTNDELTTDDGTNVEKLIQQKSYNALFDNNEGDNGFEFLWNLPGNWDSEGKLPSYVKLPTTMTFAFKTPSKLDSVEVVNRNGGNGTVQKIKAVVTFEDGSTQEFAGGEYDSFRARYAFGLSAENKGKKATKVEVTPLEASGDQMLTLREVNFNYTQGVEAIEGVELGKNQTEFFEGDVTLVDAKATPESAGYPYVTVESSDPSVVSVSAVQAGDSVSYYLRANKAGKAKITVASVLDPSKTASYEVEVKAGVDTSALVAALSKAAGYSESVYTKDSYAALTAAVEAAQKLLDGGQGSYSKKDVADATAKIEKAIDGLKMRPVDEKILINTPENRKNVKVAGFSSEADYEGSNAVNALDGDERTLWHSDWAHGTGMPQYLSVDLGRDYDLTDVTFLPRQDGGTNGDIFEAEILVSDTADGYEMGTAASMGTFAFDNDGRVLTDRGDWKQMSFGAVRGRYVTVKVIHAGGGNVDAYCSMAELKFYGTAVPDPVAKDDLATAIEKVDAEVAAGDLKAGDYTEASWTALENALASARAILSDENATQDEVDQALRALESARGALEKTPVAPVENPTKKQLKALVKQAKETDTRGKTTESVKALTDAITYAEDVLGEENASDTQLQAAYDQLKLAIESLKDADSGNQGGSGNQGSGNGSNGGNQAGKPAGDKAQGSKKNGSAIPNTGDQTAATVATVGGLGAIIAAIGAFFHRRSKAK